MWGDFARFVPASVASAVLLGLTAFAMNFCRQPARRRAIARVGLFAALAIPPAAAWLPWPRFRVGAAILGAIPAALWWVPERLGIADATLRLFSWIFREETARILSTGYGLGVGFHLARLMLGAWGTRHLSYRRSSPASPELQSFFESLTFDSRFERPSLRTTSYVRRPVLVGLFRQTILIPDAWNDSEEFSTIELALLHELAHAEARDPWYGFLGEVTHAFWFFLPPLWWISKQMRLDQEYLADRRAADRLGDSGEYAASLIELAVPNLGTKPSVIAPKGSRLNDGSGLYRRILMLVRSPFDLERNAPRSWKRLALPAFAAIAVLAALVSPRLMTGAVSSYVRSVRERPATGDLRLAAVRVAPADDASPRSVSLPLRLPETYVLQLEFWSAANELSDIRVNGMRLTDESLPRLAGGDTVHWYRVRVRQTAERAEISLDEDGFPISERIERSRAHPRIPYLSFKGSARSEIDFDKINLRW